MINYNNKIFKSLSNTSNGEVGEETIFYYKQVNNLVNAEYKGGSILQGHLIAIVNANGDLDMRYHHINTSGEIMTGICNSKPEIDEDGKIKLFEEWHWTSGDKSSGTSVIKEV